MAQIILNNLEDTIALAKKITAYQQKIGFAPIFLYGALGCGKTTLTTHIIASLPGAELAEPASPTFTLCNLYPTSPPVLHCDLYRCQTMLPDEVWEFIDNKAGQLIVEWAEYFTELPKDRLDIRFDLNDDTRRVEIAGHGLAANCDAMIFI